MITSTVKYLGELRTSCTHLKSGTSILTDAPVDNNGKGSAFSPTDLVATAYASCMITIMGIYCEKHGIHFDFAEAEVTKIMSASPRKIERLIIGMNLKENHWDEHTAEKVIRAAKACPVALTLENKVEVEFSFSI
jgi:uncharacterized OsmC-like protein